MSQTHTIGKLDTCAQCLAPFRNSNETHKRTSWFGATVDMLREHVALVCCRCVGHDYETCTIEESEVIA